MNQPLLFQRDIFTNNLRDLNIAMRNKYDFWNSIWRWVAVWTEVNKYLLRRPQHYWSLELTRCYSLYKSAIDTTSECYLGFAIQVRITSIDLDNRLTSRIFFPRSLDLQEEPIAHEQWWNSHRLDSSSSQKNKKPLKAGLHLTNSFARKLNEAITARCLTNVCICLKRLIKSHLDVGECDLLK